MREIHRSRSYQSVCRFCFFNVWNVAVFPICEKLLTEPHPDLACIARSKQHNDNPNSEANRCISVYISNWHRYQF